MSLALCVMRIVCISRICPCRPVSHRWVVPPHGSVTLRLRFASDTLGQFDQTLQLEVVGTRRRYQVHCRGTCAFPAISREPRSVSVDSDKSAVGPSDV